VPVVPHHDPGVTAQTDGQRNDSVAPVPVRENFRSVLDIVTSTLREQILDHTLRPGERLRQEDLAARLGVSRMPVRDALKRLEAEGLVTSTPRGAVVAEMSPAIIWEDYVIRSILEGAATRLGVERIDEATIAALEQVVNEMKRAQRTGNHDEELLLADRFHERLYAASGMTRLCGMIHTLRASCERYRRLFLVVPGRSALAIERRVELLAACRERDAARAEQIIRATILDNARVLLRALGSVEPQPEPAPATPAD
jgi:DNA-binding GntR family transcriptional regulator